MVAVLETRRDDADDALMPVGMEKTQRVRVSGTVGGARLDLRQRFLVHRRLDVAPLAVQAVELRRERQCGDRGVGKQAADADSHVRQTTCGVESRSGDEAEVVGGGAGCIATRGGKQRGDPGLAPPGTDARQSLRNERAIDAVESHDVGNRPQRDQVEQRREIGFRPTRESAAFAQQRARGDQHVEHDADTREVLGRKGAAWLIGIDDERGRGKRRCGQMMIGDQHVDAVRGSQRPRPRGSRCRCRRLR